MALAVALAKLGLSPPILTITGQKNGYHKTQISVIPEIRRRKTKIVLVAHSREESSSKKLAYIFAREDPDFKDVANRIHTLYFLATPHRGSDLSETLANILRVTHVPKPFLNELAPNSESIAATNDTFRHFAGDVQLYSFYETQPSYLGLTKALIVNKTSATLGYLREQSSLMNADHRGICKFDRSNDPNYQILRNAFVTTLYQIASEASFAAQALSLTQHRQLIELVRISEPPINEFDALNELRVSHSCEWIRSKDLYPRWLYSEPIPQRPVFWITGKAGFGKSVLSGYVINDIQQQDLQCSYFFFKHGNSFKSSIVGCLRSLAYQAAVCNTEILKALVEILKEAAFQEQWDEKTIWRRLFIGCIFKQFSAQPYFWVLDGLDECHQFPVLINMITRSQLPPKLRIFITSRTTPETAKSLNKMSKIAEGYEIQESDTFDDIRRYIHARMDNISAFNLQLPQTLGERILQKASGSFLWVSLVIKDLENAYSEEDAEEILNEVPTDMNEVYSRMMETLLQNPRAAVLAKELFMWTLMAFRSLNIPELQLILKLGVNQTVPNLIKALPVICGHLVSVNQKMEAEVIHETTKSYLFQQKIYPQLELSVGESHSRMARLCLKFLMGNFFSDQGKSSENLMPMMKDNGNFGIYACDYFSHHLQKCTSKDPATWELLCSFLNNNVVSWVEYLAKKKSLADVTSVAINLQSYLKNRVENPISGEVDVESWITDLIRLSGRFGSYLNTSPSAMRTLILPLCPSNTIIRRTYLPKHRGLIVKGLLDKAWDDCIARIDYSGRPTTAVACGELFSAVALADGSIYLYYQDSIQLKNTLRNEEKVTILSFSCEDRYLASTASRCVKVWDPVQGTQVWSFNISHQPLALLFLNGNSTLAVATQGNYTISWDLEAGQQVREWRWNLCIDESPTQQKPTQQPREAVFSSDYRTIAVTYRGLPIYLFDIQSERFIGCCGHSARILSKVPANHYVVDAMTFNPNPEIDALVVSYGYGELIIYDVGTAQLRHSIPDVYANSLACSPEGRTLVTGSARGTIRIFEFAGVGGEKLINFYKIDTYEDCIKAITFSCNGLRFADIRGTQYRVWEPVVLFCNDLGQNFHSNSTQSITITPKSVSMLEGPPDGEITALCCSPTGDVAFCGNQDGSVVYFKTQTAEKKGLLYQHAAGTRITSIAFMDKTSFLATADESGRILINQITALGDELKVKKLIVEMRFGKEIAGLISNVSGTKILVVSRTNAEIWTTEGESVGLSITHESGATFINHHHSDNHFVFTEHQKVRIFSWKDGMEIDVRSQDLLKETGSLVTPSSEPDTELNLSSYIVRFTKERPTALLNVWFTSTVLGSTVLPQPIPIPSFDNLSNKISQIIAVEGSLIFFLDTNLWVCSLDMAGMGLKTHGVKRHFFLLSEWQTVDGGFIIDYVPATKEFVIVRKHELLVVSRGLEFEEPWFVT